MNIAFRTERLTTSLTGRLSGAVLWLIAAAHIVMLAALFLTLASLQPAAAAQDDSCGGRNLLTDMQQKEPERYQALVKQAAEIPNGQGIFWRIEKTGLAPSFLLGTMHVTDPRVLTMPEGAKQAFASASTVIVESDEILDDRKIAASLLARPDLTMLMDGKSITDMLSKDNVARLTEGLKSRGIPLNAVSRMTPWMVSSFVALPACEFTRKAKGAAFLDKQIALDAVAGDKKLVGLETMVEQLSAMADLPMQFHLQALIETLEIGDLMNDVMATMTELYLSGDIGMTMPMLMAVTPQPKDNAENGYADFEKRIITDRNHVMAERAAPYLEKGSVFMAVGALHLPDTEGLVELLRKQGYTVTPAI